MFSYTIFDHYTGRRISGTQKNVRNSEEYLRTLLVQIYGRGIEILMVCRVS